MSIETSNLVRSSPGQAILGGLLALGGLGVGVVIGTVANSGPEESCLEALDAADEVITLSGEGLMHAGEAFGAIERMDLLTLDQSVAKLELLVEPAAEAAEQYTEVKEECRNA